MITLSEGNFLGIMLEALLFGAATIMFVLSMYVMFWKKRKQVHRNYTLIVAACVLQCLAFAELIDNTVYLWRGLIITGPNGPGASDQYYARFTEPPYLIKSVLYNIQTMILDGVVIYRTYLIWQTFWVIVVPCLGWIGLFIGTIGLNYALATAKNEYDVFAQDTGSWIQAVYGITLGTNLSASILLAYKVWSIDRASRKYKSYTVLGPVTLAIIESGALYSVAVTASLICFVIGTPIVYITLNILSPIICICFHMIIVRIAFASRSLLPTAINPTVPGTTTGTATYVGQTPSGDRRRGLKQTDTIGDTYQLQSLAVEVSKYVETDAVSEGEGKIDHDREFSSESPTSKSPGLAA